MYIPCILIILLCRDIQCLPVISYSYLLTGLIEMRNTSLNQRNTIQYVSVICIIAIVKCNIQAAPYQPLHFNMLLVLHVGAIVDQYICLLL